MHWQHCGQAEIMRRRRRPSTTGRVKLKSFGAGRGQGSLMPRGRGGGAAGRGDDPRGRESLQFRGKSVF